MAALVQPLRPGTATLCRIETYLSEQVIRGRVPGAAYAVVHGREVILAGALGRVSPGDGAPVTPDTLFQIGSLAKGFTAMAVLQLREQGLIDLDQPVRQYLPWFELADAEEASRLTVRHLLDQVSGLANGTWKVGLQPEAKRSAEATVRALRSVRPTAAAPAKWQYANTNYIILGAIISAVTGQPYAQYITEQILRPLGMVRSTFDLESALAAEHSAPTVTQLGQVVATSPDEGTWAEAAGLGLWSSATEMCRWLSAHLGAGTSGSLLPAGAFAESHSGIVETGMHDVRYGLGWFNTEFHGSRLIFNMGGTAGHSAALCFLPAENLGIVILLGTNSGSANRLALNVARILKGQEPDVPDLFPDFSGVFQGFVAGCTAVGALALAGLAVHVGRAGLALSPVAGVLAIWAAAVLALVPGAVKRSPRMPVPMPMNVGPHGWPLNLMLSWWLVQAGSIAWAVYAVVSFLA